jgi:hypothetical protein
MPTDDDPIARTEHIATTVPRLADLPNDQD